MPTSIHIDVDDGITFVEFVVERLAPIFCQRSQKIGHRLDAYEDDMQEQDDLLILSENKAIPLS